MRPYIYIQLGVVLAQKYMDRLLHGLALAVVVVCVLNALCEHLAGGGGGGGGGGSRGSCVCGTTHSNSPRWIKGWALQRPDYNRYLLTTRQAVPQAVAS